MCQGNGSKRLGKVPPVRKSSIHRASASAAQRAATRKKGRKASDHKVAGGICSESRAAAVTTHLARPANPHLSLAADRSAPWVYFAVSRGQDTRNTRREVCARANPPRDFLVAAIFRNSQ